MRVPIVMLSGPAGSGKDAVAAALVKNHGAVAIAQADPMKRLAMKLFGFSDEQLWGPSSMRNAPDLQAGPRADDAVRGWFLIASEFLREVLPDGQAGTSLWHWFDSLRREAVLSPRRVLQTLGTEWGRAYSKNMWVDLALASAQRLLGGGYAYDRRTGLWGSDDATAPRLVVITDGRFRNEMLAVRQVGGATVRIVSPGAGLSGAAALHASETEQGGISDSWFDAVLVNHKEHGLGQLERAVRNLVVRLDEPIARISTWAADHNAEVLA